MIEDEIFYGIYNIIISLVSIVCNLQPSDNIKNL